MANSDGTSSVTINVTELRPGWIRIGAGERSPTADQLPRLLDRALHDWLTEHATAEVRATLPIMHGGNTVAIHVWYDQPAD